MTNDKPQATAVVYVRDSFARVCLVGHLHLLSMHVSIAQLALLFFHQVAVKSLFQITSSAAHLNQNQMLFR